MPIANVALTDTFDTQRIRLNQEINRGNDNEITIPAAFAKANAAPGIANTYATAVGVAGNAYAVAVGTSGNAYAAAVSAAAFAKANAAPGIANTYATAVGASGNAYAVSVGTSGNTYAAAVSAAAFSKANNALANTSGAVFVGNLSITGNVGIGTTTPNSKLDIVGNITSSNTIFAVHFDNVSDLSFKENIQTITNSIQTLSQLNPVSFNWKKTKNKSYGLIAQEVEKILPTIVHQKPDGTRTINYIEIIAFLIQAIKEQQKQIDDINNHINDAE